MNRKVKQLYQKAITEHGFKTMLLELTATKIMHTYPTKSPGYNKGNKIIFGVLGHTDEGTIDILGAGWNTPGAWPPDTLLSEHLVISKVEGNEIVYVSTHESFWRIHGVTIQGCTDGYFFMFEKVNE